MEKDRSISKRIRIETAQRIEAAQEKVREIVKTGTCPDCGHKLKRNLSLTGWWQCEQFGALQFRTYADKPQCSWQGFTK